MADLASEKQEAYQRLVQVARRYAEQGKNTRSAGVKPALSALYLALDAEFDEQQLGFPTFRAFLEAAEDAGYVVLRPVANAPDVAIFPADEAVAEPSVSGPSLDRVRADFWAAFVDWRRGWERLYDRVGDQVGWLPVSRSYNDEQLALHRRV